MVIVDGYDKMTWNGKPAMLGLPVEKKLQDGKLLVNLTFEGEFSEGLRLSMQYSDNKTRDVGCTIVPKSGYTDVTIKLPDMPEDVDKRYAKLLFHEWRGKEAPSIIRVEVSKCECE